MEYLYYGNIKSINLENEQKIVYFMIDEYAKKIMDDKIEKFESILNKLVINYKKEALYEIERIKKDLSEMKKIMLKIDKENNAEEKQKEIIRKNLEKKGIVKKN